MDHGLSSHLNPKGRPFIMRARRFAPRLGSPGITALSARKGVDSVHATRSREDRIGVDWPVCRCRTSSATGWEISARYGRNEAQTTKSPHRSRDEQTWRYPERRILPTLPEIPKQHFPQTQCLSGNMQRKN